MKSLVVLTEETEVWRFYLRGDQAEKGGGHVKSHFNSAEDDSHCQHASYPVSSLKEKVI